VTQARERLSALVDNVMVLQPWWWVRIETRKLSLIRQETVTLFQFSCPANYPGRDEIAPDLL
jgi:hypothetical protein